MINFKDMYMNLRLFAISSFLSSISFAQSGQPFQFEKIGGLSQNTVYSIITDKKGFMWIATANGLNRYDGAAMKAYKPSYGTEKSQMKGRIIRSALFENDKEQLWFGTDQVINCFNKKQQVFTQHKLYRNKGNKETKEGVPDVEMFANPLMERNGTVWFATAVEGLFALSTETNKCINYPVTISDENGESIPLMYNGVYNGKDQLWFATRKGLLCFNTGTGKWNRFLPDQSFFSITICRDTIYLGSNTRIDWFDTRSHTSGEIVTTNVPVGIRQGMIRRIITDSKNNLWAGDQEGNIFQKAASGKKFEWKGNINGNARTNFPVYCLYADTTGNLWVGADVLGLLKAEISTPGFKKFPDASAVDISSQGLFVYSIYEDENDKVWLGTFQNGIFVVDKATGKSSRLNFPYFDPKLQYGKSVPLIKKDGSGRLWTSYSAYLYVKEKGADNFIPVKMPVPNSALQSPQLNSIAEYKNGWLAGTNIGLYFIEKSTNNYAIRHISSFNQSRIISIWVSPEGKIWVVPESEGIMIFNDPGDKKEEKRIFTGLNVKSIQYDEKKQLTWISTSDGLIAYHSADDQYRFYTEQDGLNSSLVYGVVTINDKLWASTNNGLAKGKLVFKKDSPFPDIHFINYTVAEGLPVNEFNTGAFYKGQSGTLYFGSTKGVVWFKPEDIKTMNIQPNLQLTNFLVNEKQADSLTAPEYISSVSLPYYKNNLFFQFRVIDFNNADKVRYKYQLEGWDKDWVYSNTLNEVRYNNLPHGKYIFKVAAAGNLGIWNSEMQSVLVAIYPPFWKTWWFYTLSASVVLLIIIIITRFLAQQKLKNKIAELEKQKEIDKERQRISREMHDDIGAGLTQITLMSESAKTKHGTGELDDIAQTSRQLVSNMSEIIWSLNPENKTLEQLLSYLREQLNKQLEYSGMNYSIQLPESGSLVVLSNEQRRNILLVTKEIINNAVKYSKARNISVQASLSDSNLDFEIADDGTGFDITIKRSGNGLKNIRHRIEELGGVVDVESAPGKGSRFVYSIPLRRTT